MKLPFVKYRLPFAILSLIAVFTAFVVIATYGLNYGIDFKGGVKLEYQFATPVTEEEVREALVKLDLGDVSVVRFGQVEERRMSIKAKLPEEHASLAPQISAALEKVFGEGSVTLDQEETVGPKVGKELRKKAWLTILFSWVLMLIYIGYRFDFMFAPGAVLALIHDVVITLGIFSFLGKEINLTILAAILTIIGYSINDTIVVFDRIREHKNQIRPDTLNEVVNESLNATLSRTLMTSVSVLLVVVVLFLKGGGTLHDFAFAIIIGVLVGTYSSLFVATPTYITLFHWWPKLSKRGAK